MAETMYATLFFMCSLPKSDLLKEIRLKHFFFAASRTKDCNSIRALWYSVSKNNVFFFWLRKHRRNQQQEFGCWQRCWFKTGHGCKAFDFG